LKNLKRLWIYKDRLGLTKAEKKALLIIVITLTSAGILQLLRPVQQKQVDIDYSVSDSLFNTFVSGERRPEKRTTVTKLTAERININTASVQELENLPGVGKTIAQRIIAYRKQNGPFNSPDDLLKVKGLGVKKINQIKDKIVF
jgi:comEA protein